MTPRVEMHKAAPEAYQAMRTLFSEEEIAKLSLAIATINAWNRLAVGMRFVPKG